MEDEEEDEEQDGEPPDHRGHWRCVLIVKSKIYSVVIVVRGGNGGVI